MAEKSIGNSHKRPVVFVGKTPFPVSTASSNRILSLGKGLSSAGHLVKVFCFGATKHSTSENTIQRKGEINGVYWEFTSLVVNAKKNRLLNGFILLIGQVLGYIKITSQFLGKSPHVFTSQTTIGYILPIWFVARLCGGRLFYFRSEYPEGLLKNKKGFRYIEKFVYPNLFKVYEKCFFMTYGLSSYYEQWIDKEKIEIAPLTIDLSLFEKKEPSPFQFKYIVYSGSLSNRKDGVDILIKAFSKIYKKYPDYKLVVIGGAKSENDFDEAVANYYLDITNKDSIVFTGLIPFADIPKYLTNASIMVLARPNSVQAKGGFPSKLGEYLATGNPVVVTDTGEITRYLKNGYSAMIARPNDVDDFADKLEVLIENTIYAEEIGDNGKRVALENFDFRKIGAKISNVICEIEG